MEVNHKNEEAPSFDMPQNGQPKLTREQRRMADRLEEKAKQTSLRLCEKFYEYFFENDPEAPEIKEKIKELSAKWRMFCKQNQLREEAYDFIEKYAAAIIEEYNITKNGTDGNQVPEGTV